ncbi:MAG TPA: hypothetical protein VFN51_03670, partial [Candidatus Saccharimonadales bacterium]|nr:hypothetical protein [Candidatus Saccharimonadales bacterium]
MNSPELGPQPVAPHQLGELARKLEAIIPFCEQPYLEYGNTSLVYSFGEPQPTLSDDNPTESFTAYNIIIDLNINGLSQDDTQAAQSFYEAINRFY